MRTRSRGAEREPEGAPGQPRADALPEPQLAEHMVFRPAAPSGFSVERLGEGVFAVTGRGSSCCCAL